MHSSCVDAIPPSRRRPRAAIARRPPRRLELVTQGARRRHLSRARPTARRRRERLTATPNDTYLVSWTPDSRAAGRRRGSRRRRAGPALPPRPRRRHDAADRAVAGLLPAWRRDRCRAAAISSSPRNLDPATGAARSKRAGSIRQDLADGRAARAGAAAEAECFPAAPRSQRHARPLRAARPRSRRDTDLAGRHRRQRATARSSISAPASRRARRWFPDSRRLLVLAETADAQAARRLRHSPSGEHHLAHRRCRAQHRGARSCRTAAIASSPIETREARSRAFSARPADRRRAAGRRRPRHAAAARRRRRDGAWIGRRYAQPSSPTTLVRFRWPAAARRLPQRLARPWRGQRAARGRPRARRRISAGARSTAWRSRAGSTARGQVARHSSSMSMAARPAHSEDRAQSAFIQFFVAAGFVVLDPNYRGSTGFGLAFREAISRTAGAGRAGRHPHRHRGADRARRSRSRGSVGITGTSYGGYSSWCADHALARRSSSPRRRRSAA